MIKVQGHRGSRGTHFENTLPAFQEALDAGAAGIELDLHLTRDGAAVIHHDFFINPSLLTYLDGRRVEREILIYECEVKRIKQFQYGKGVYIPTLDELFQFLQDKEGSFRINLEMKRDPLHPRRTAEPWFFAKQVVSTVRRFQFEERVYYSSFDPLLLQEVRKLHSRAVLGLVIGAEDFFPLYEKNFCWMRDWGIKIVSPEHSVLDGDEVEKIKGWGFSVIPWTVNHPERFRQLCAMGVDEIITDYPRQLYQYIFS